MAANEVLVKTLPCWKPCCWVVPFEWNKWKVAFIRGFSSVITKMSSSEKDFLMLCFWPNNTKIFLALIKWMCPPWRHSLWIFPSDSVNEQWNYVLPKLDWVIFLSTLVLFNGGDLNKKLHLQQGFLPLQHKPHVGSLHLMSRSTTLWSHHKILWVWSLQHNTKPEVFICVFLQLSDVKC